MSIARRYALKPPPPFPVPEPPLQWCRASARYLREMTVFSDREATHCTPASAGRAAGSAAVSGARAAVASAIWLNNFAWTAEEVRIFYFV